MLKRIPSLAILIAAMAAALSSAEQPSFTGTWKLNMAKSQLAGQTMTVQKNASGLYHYDSGGFEYDFDLHGKQCPTPDGGTTAWG